MTAETDYATEDKVAGFRFIKTIYAGPTAVTSEVYQESTGKRFAMKQLLASRAGDASERKKFEFEAKLGMKLLHPNLIRVIEYMRKSHPPYFIMDLFQGLNLSMPISRPSVYPMPVAQLHGIMEQAASGLAYMHSEGWIHRDVKPANMLVNKQGDTRVIDLALAKQRISLLGKLLGGKPPREGTPTYMSPEQIRCESPSPAADIYSFGITCYELACGRPPFRGNSTSELLNKHLAERPTPLTSHNKAITPEFNDLVLNMLQKRPTERLASLEEFLARFAKVRIYQDDPDPATQRGRSRESW